jgi:predicted helicase
VSPVRRRKLFAAKHQVTAVKEVLRTFKKHRRAQLLMACGTGKTLVSLLVAEAGRFKTIAVFVPSLALVRQVLSEYTASTSWAKWSAIAVCSDPTVTDDSVYVAPQEVGCDVTTDSEEISAFVAKTGVRVVFSLRLRSQCTNRLREARGLVAARQEGRAHLRL